MGHHIRGFIAHHANLHRAAIELDGAHVIPLRQGFGFLPVTAQLVRDEELIPFAHVERLSERLGKWASEHSRNFAIAYVETDYFGGDGWQSAIVWANNEIAFGPVRTSDLDSGNLTPLLEGAINRAMRMIGVYRGAVRDEFDALGLGKHRSNEAWIAEAHAG